jgi:hypothetical protein
VCFSQGLDIRLVDKENAELLAKLKYYDFDFTHRRLYFAFDYPKLRDTVIKNVKLLVEAGIPARHLMFFLLVGYNTSFEEDWMRFKTVMDLGCTPFVMVYNNRKDRTLLRDFARWVNGRGYKIVNWKDYLARKQMARRYRKHGRGSPYSREFTKSILPR